MIRAGSLTYAIFLALVTAILCSMMVLVAWMNRSFFIRTDRQEVVRDNAYSGIAQAMAGPFGTDREGWADLFEAGEDSVYVKIRRWGPYHLTCSRAVSRKEEYLKTALIGCNSPFLEKTALWLTDKNRPLQLAGEALLKGECHLPPKGVDRAYVEGTSYQRGQLVYGENRRSTGHLIATEKGLKEYWEGYFKREYSAQDSLIAFRELPMLLMHSFRQRTLVVHSPSAMDLSGFSLTGNIILISQKSLKVPASAHLKNVVLMAPVIQVEKGARLTAHLVATDTVKLEERVLMEYPSSITMAGTGPRNPFLMMEEGARLYGTLLSYNATDQRTNDLAMEIVKGATIRGLVYCEGNLELGGRVEGIVLANQFLLATPSGIYENHLLNGEVDRTALPPDFATLSLEGTAEHQMIATWY